MVDFVVDNSIAVAWAYPRQATEYTEKVLELSGNAVLHAAFIWPAEFANTANTLVNRGLLSDGLGAEMILFADYFGLMVDRAPTDMSKLYRVSREYRLSAYDAAYLELSIRLKLPLATCDKDLRRAAESLDLYLV